MAFLQRIPRRAPTERSTFLWIAVVGALALSAASWMGGNWHSRLHAADGDVLEVSDVLSSPGRQLIDLTLDTTDGTFWLLGANGSSEENHQLYHVDAEFNTVLGTLPNPHPMGSIGGNDLTLNRGITEGFGGHVYILSSVGNRSSQMHRVEAIDRAGAPVAGIGFDIDLSGMEGGNLFGLAFDPISRQFWTRDIENQRILRVALDGNIASALPLPSTVGQTDVANIVRGRGLAFDANDTALYLTWGDIVSTGPRKVLQFASEADADGIADRTGIEVSLDRVPTEAITGIVTYAIATLRRIALIGDDNLIYILEQQLPDPIPPTQLSARLTRSNQVSLEWVNNGSGAGGDYGGSVQILRNGIPFAVVSGTAHNYMDLTPEFGLTEYSLRAADVPDGPLSPASCASTVTVGPGGVIDATILPTLGCYDVTVVDPTGDILVTDDSSGVIHVLDQDLDAVGTFQSPWARPGGIAYVDKITVGLPIPPGNAVDILDAIAVANFSDNRVRVSTRADPDVGTTISLRFPASIESPVIGGLSFLSAEQQANQRLIVVERTTNSIFSFDPNGQLRHDCIPPNLFITAPLSGGIDYDPLEDTHLAVFEDCAVRELFTGGDCPPPPEQFSLRLESLGTGCTMDGFVGGIAISDNTLLVCKRENGTLFRHLIFPFSPDFIRGDFDRNTEVDLSDGIGLVTYLFRDGSPPVCLDAADCNDDGNLDLNDVLYLLFALFDASSQPPPPPFPEPGNDPTFRDNLGCAE